MKVLSKFGPEQIQVCETVLHLKIKSILEQE